MDWGAIASGIGAILTAAGAMSLLIHEIRRRDRKSMQVAIDEVTAELIILQHDYLELRKFMVHITQLLNDQGIDPPEVPRHES